LLESLNLHHPLVVLAKLIDWNGMYRVADEAVGPDTVVHRCVHAWSRACGICNSSLIDYSIVGPEEF